MQKKWNIKASIPPEISNRLEAIRSLLLANRGLTGAASQEAFFNPKKPEELSLLDVGVPKPMVETTLKRLEHAKVKQEPIIIYGDYDADGITSTGILWECLHELGFKVMPFLPHREEQGYGLKPKGIEAAISQLGKPALLMTVDNGIVAFEGAQYCKEQGIDLIICDHHEAHGDNTENTRSTKITESTENIGRTQKTERKLPIVDSKLQIGIGGIKKVQEAQKTHKIQLPEALAVVHSTQTSGAGLALLLAKTILDHFGGGGSDTGRSQTRPYRHLLELATIGIIADLVPLTGVSRSLVKHGLEQLPKTQRLGLKKLYEEANLHQLPVFSPYHIGFIIAPRLNATGRLDHCMDSLRLLCTKDETRATALANILGMTNRTRQDLTHSSVEQVVQQVTQQRVKKLIVTHSEAYNPGVIGLIAGKLVEQFYRPSIAIAVMGEDAKGSVRSVPGVNIIELLRKAQAEFLELGGHPMAAGFSVATSNIENLIHRLEALAEEFIEDQHLIPTLNAETEIAFSDISLELYESLLPFAPFGIGNPTPVFVSRNVTVEDARTVGKEGKHLKLRVRQVHKNTENTKAQKAQKHENIKTREQEINETMKQRNNSSLSPNPYTLNPVFDAIFFSAGEWVETLKLGDTVDLAYQIELNEWNGRKNIQLAVKDIHKPSL